MGGVNIPSVVPTLATPAWVLKLLVIAGLGLLYADVFGGALRYTSITIGVPALSYWPIPLAALASIVALLSLLRPPVRGIGLILSLGAFTAFGLVVALFYGRPMAGVGMSLYVLMPLMLGLTLAYHGQLDKILPHILLLWVGAVVGIYLNLFISMPWTGFEYQVGDQILQTTREWTASGVDRLAGFSRASFSAANQINLLGLILMCTYRHWWLRLLVFGVSFIAIYLTTSKMPMVAFLLGSLAILGNALVAPALKRSYNILAGLAAAGLMIAFPLLALVWRDFSSLFAAEGVGFLNFESMVDRIMNTWPQAFQLLPQHIGQIFGLGFGGIGVPQQVVNDVLFNPADNMFVYLYAIFGIFSLILISLMLRPLRHDYGYINNQIVLAFTLSVMGIGLAANIIESPTMALAAGVLLGLQKVFKTS